MWFRLKRDYKFRKSEIHLDSWGNAKLRRGAPIHVSLELGPDKAQTPRARFVYACGGLQHLKLDQLALPSSCLKNRMGDVFCATTDRFFISVAHYGSTWSCEQLGRLLARQLIHCPLCGRKLEGLADYPYAEQEGFLVKLKKGAA